MLIPQDVVRREILKVKDGSNNPSIQLIYDMVLYGNRIGYTVILEGILANKHYGEMLHKLIDDFDGNTLAYYFDIPFEETLKRHATKPNATDYGAVEMRQWWNDKDYLGIAEEKCFDAAYTADQIVDVILKDVGFQV